MKLSGLSDDDIMINLKGQILVTLTKHAGQRIVHGDEMESLIADFVTDVLTDPSRRRWAAEHLRRVEGGHAPEFLTVEGGNDGVWYTCPECDCEYDQDLGGSASVADLLRVDREHVAAAHASRA